MTKDDKKLWKHGITILKLIHDSLGFGLQILVSGFLISGTYIVDSSR